MKGTLPLHFKSSPFTEERRLAEALFRTQQIRSQEFCRCCGWLHPLLKGLMNESLNKLDDVLGTSLMLRKMMKHCLSFDAACADVMV